ncbi:MAG: hypothetical protein H6989_06340 [Pseudomonadales bacterium]|nr:hypothetical protein [Pseudomonadales bacterium]
MVTNQIIRLDVSVLRMLLADWVRKFGQESGLPIGAGAGQGNNRYTIGDPKTYHLVAEYIEQPPFLKVTPSDPNDTHLVCRFVEQAWNEVKAVNFGGLSWYSVILAECDNDYSLIDRFVTGAFLQQLGAQQRIAGWRRLGGNILLEFVEDLPPGWGEPPQLFAPRAQVHVHMAIPCPCVGFFSSHIAHGLIETVSAICNFALGRRTSVPPHIFPSDQEKVPELSERIKDGSVGTLARKGVSLDIFTGVELPERMDHLLRLRSAMITYDAATQQQRNSVACVLYVAAAESLSVPRADWKREKIASRFEWFFEQLIPEVLDKIVGHRNFEEAFKIKRGNKKARALRKELLNRIYSFRSGNLHEGFSPSPVGLIGALGAIDGVRRGLFAEFSEKAILAYMQSPRSSLVGHPGIHWGRQHG